ncbi:MAG: adhesin [Methanothrix sp.]|nr:MAG: adhesin [Methanothrix sp.]
MIDITDAAAEKLNACLVEGKVIRLYVTSYVDPVPSYSLGLGVTDKRDVIFESNGISIHMNPMEAEEMRIAVVDYIDDERRRGFIVHTPQPEVCGVLPCDECLSCD